MKCYLVVSSEPFGDFVEVLLCTTDFKSVSDFLRENTWDENDNLRIQVWSNSHITEIYEYNAEAKQLTELWSEVDMKEVE